MSVVIDENIVPNVVKKTATKGKKTIEETYTKKTQLEHILLRPDTYGTCTFVRTILSHFYLFFSGVLY